jgi:hypothetical protein
VLETLKLGEHDCWLPYWDWPRPNSNGRVTDPPEDEVERRKALLRQFKRAYGRESIARARDYPIEERMSPQVDRPYRIAIWSEWEEDEVRG